MNRWHTLLLGCAIALIGCVSAKNPLRSTKNPLRSVESPWNAVIPGGGAEVDLTDPAIVAAIEFTKWGVLMVVGGLIIGSFVKFRSGWVANIVGSGVGLILLAWTFKHPLMPYLALLSLVGYAVYKVYNRMNPNAPTERVFE